MRRIMLIGASLLSSFGLLSLAAPPAHAATPKLISICITIREINPNAVCVGV